MVFAEIPAEWLGTVNVLGALVLTVLLLLGYRLFMKHVVWRNPTAEPPVRRGNPMAVPDGALERGASELYSATPVCTWGATTQVPISPTLAKQHFMLVGKSGSGKTVTLKNLMLQVFSGFKESDQKAVIYDPTGEFYALARRNVETVLLNPFDSRSVAWDIATDVLGEGDADAVAAILIPVDDKEHQKHFPRTARKLVAGVIRTFCELKKTGKATRDWTLRDVLCACNSSTVCRYVLESTPATKPLVQQHFHDTPEFLSVFSTVGEHLHSYRTIAAAWCKSHEDGASMSLNAWADDRLSSRVLVVGANREHETALRPINTLLIQRLLKRLFGDHQPTNVPAPKTWVMLDEFTQIGKLFDMSVTLESARTYGITFALAFQTLEGVQAVYGGQDEAGAVLGNISNKAFFKTTSRKTAEFMEGLLGGEEFLEEMQESSSTTGRGSETSHTTSTKKSWRKRPNVLADEFLGLPPTSVHNGLTGYFITDFAMWKDHLPGDEFPPQIANEFHPRPSDHFDLQLWTVEDMQQLGMPGDAGVLRKLLGLEEDVDENPGQERDEEPGEVPDESKGDDSDVTLDDMFDIEPEGPE